MTSPQDTFVIPVSRRWWGLMPAEVYFKPRNVWKARIVVQGNSVIKDYTKAPFIPRMFGRFCLKREERALNRLKGLEGIPLFLDKPTPYKLAMTWVPGTPLEKLKKGDVSELFLEKLRALFEEMHKRGIAHCDAHFRNIMISEDAPFIIDFSTAYIKPVNRKYIKHLFLWACRLDFERLYKVENAFFGRGEPPKMFLLYNLIKKIKKMKRKKS